MNYFSEAEITPIETNVWSNGPGIHISPNGPDHEISCVLTDIPGHVTGVKWDPAEPLEGFYTLKDGFFDGRSNKQVSTLKITSREVANLLEKIESDKVIFTCEIALGHKQTSVTATQTVNLYASKHLCCI